MRLIDADKLNFDGLNVMYAKKLKTILDFIDNQPTAYDKEKVIEQLKKQDGVCDGCLRKYECNECSIGERINIVKAGGVNE